MSDSGFDGVIGDGVESVVTVDGGSASVTCPFPAVPFPFACPFPCNPANPAPSPLAGKSSRWSKGTTVGS